MIEELINKKILILGLGREGESTYRLLRRLWPEKELGLADQANVSQLSREWKHLIQSDKNLALHLGQDYLKRVGDYEVIFKTPGISFRLPEIKKALKQGVVVTSQTEVCLNRIKERAIGITGTKGKTTTASLIHHLIKSHHPSFLIGNMGIPAFSCWEESERKNAWFVCELSSHQLDRLEISPHIAVFLNLMPDHLDYFDNIEEYYQAKSNIARHQQLKDKLIYNGDDEKVTDAARSSSAQKLSFGAVKQEQNLCFWDKGKLWYRKRVGEDSEPVLSIEDLEDCHPSARLNLVPAVMVAKMLGVSNEAIVAQLKTFHPPQDRLEFIGEYNGISFYNDSAATIPQATISAINAFAGKIGTLIVGGSEKGTDFTDLAEKIVENKIPHLIAFPTTGLKIAKLVEDKANSLGQNIPEIKVAESMEEAVKHSYQVTSVGQICLLSPASASFTIFKNYHERGESFSFWARKLSQAE